MEAAAQKLRIAIPVTIMLIFLLIYLNFGNVRDSHRHAIQLQHVGSVAVGFIAFAGVATQTAIVMIVYLDEAYFHAKREGWMQTMKTWKPPRSTVPSSARPVVMTATAMIIGLLPIMFGQTSPRAARSAFNAPTFWMPTCGASSG